MELFNDNDVNMDVFDMKKCDEAAWSVIDSHFRNKSLVNHQIESFNEFMEKSIQQIVLNTPPIELQGEAQHKKHGPEKPVRCTIRFGQIYIGKPTHFEASGASKVVFPSEARLRNLSYAAPLFVDVTQTYVEDGRKTSEKTLKHVNLGNVPVMVKSAYCSLSGASEEDLNSCDECAMDPGGYFIINGTERVIVPQERIASNDVMVLASKDDKYSFRAEIRSVDVNSSRGVSSFVVGMKRAKKDQGEKIVCTLPRSKEEIPVMILFRALGFETDRAILQKVVYDMDDYKMVQALMPSIIEASSVQNQDVALCFIGARVSSPDLPLEKKKKNAIEFLQKELLPHIGTDGFCNKRKAYFVGYMVHRLLQVALDRRPADDRDHLLHKRIDSTGSLLRYLFKGAFKGACQTLKLNAQKFVDKGKDFDVAWVMNPSHLTDGLNYPMATGIWSTNKKSANVRTGVSQVLNRMNYMSSISHLRRVNTPIERDSKLAKPRQMNTTTWGKFCPAETPEGESVGLLKSLSLMAHVTIGCSDLAMGEFLEDRGMKTLDEVPYDSLSSASKIFVNGNWVGVHDNLDQIWRSLKDVKRAVISFSTEISVSRNYSIEKGCHKNELRILTDSGRICRPLLVVENNRLVIDNCDLNTLKRMEWDELITSGVVEYLDAMEEESCMIAMMHHEVYQGGSKFTHCEIHPSMILGVCASIIPFPDHNQSPRNIYQSAMCKQSLGMNITNFDRRMDTMAHELFYPQKPLSSSKASKYVGFQELPAGTNAITVIAAYTGFNQEDSIIMNSSSIDRGFFRSMFYKCYKNNASQSHYGQEEFLEKPDKEIVQGAKKVHYDKLGEDGLVAPGMLVSEKDAVIGKTKALPEKIDELNDIRQKFTKTDCSTILKKNESGIVDKVLRTVDKDGSQLVKIRVRNIRIPQTGDKFASRHGQKGTIGITFRQEDMPFTAEGITPDIVINPHAIPSRMTIGHMIECLQSKGVALSGKLGDSTPFGGETSVETIADVLKKFGFHEHGNEVVYNGFTGEKITTPVFVGPTYYQKLKHMVEDKFQARPRGPVQILNRQPLEGRARNGGMRFGEMERDCQIAHGSASFLRDKLLYTSDTYSVTVCSHCGLTFQADPQKNMVYCKSCNSLNAKPIELPYSCKLLFQELMGMSICPRIIHDKSHLPQLTAS